MTCVHYIYSKQVSAKDSHLYALCRYVKPNIVVETGVHHGVSSSFILSALHHNQNGHLYSIDLPNVKYETDHGGIHTDQLLKGESPGFLVEDYLRGRWTLILGDSKEALPKLLGGLGPESIDIFYHDSKHTYEHMLFEFQTVWPYLKTGGLLLSDDVEWNNAFSDFSKCHDDMRFSFVSNGSGVIVKN